MPDRPERHDVTPDAVESWHADMRVAAPDAGPALWEQEYAWLMKRWGEGHRAYHSRQHLRETLSALAELGSTDHGTTGQGTDRERDQDADQGAGGHDAAMDVTVARIALWYHDAVYDTRAEPGSNEHRSAALARDHLHHLGVATAVVDRVEAIIMATSDHAAGSSDPAWPLVHDADLWILAAPPQRYAEYCSQVRREYAHVPEAQFRSARAAVMTSLIDRPQIYLTPPARHRWTAVARRNVTAELRQLRGDTRGNS